MLLSCIKPIKTLIRRIAEDMVNQPNLIKKTFFLLFFSTFLLSCGKWKKTTTVDFQFEINKISNISFLNFQGGHIHLQEISFEGGRKQGKDVAFHHSAEGIKADFTSGGTYPPIVLDIPQGTYNSIEVEVDNKEGVTGEPSILINGTYINGMGSTPFRFEFNSSETFEVEAEADNGGKEIVLIEDMPAIAKVVFDPNYWFSTVTQSMLDNATLTNIMGTPTIVISTSSNEDIYDIVVDRIDDATEAVFN